MPAAGLLLVGHGSRLDRAADEMTTLLELVRARLPGVAVAHGWLELEEPEAGAAGVALVRAHALDTVVVQPLLLFSAYHATADVPRVAAVIDAGAPRVRVRAGRAFGIDRRLLALATERIAGVVEVAQEGDALLVVSSGTSDADALAHARTAAHELGSLTGHTLVDHARASITGDEVPRSVVALAAQGATSVTVFSWSLLAGRLVATAQQQAEETALDAGVRITFAGRFGPDPVVADLLVERYHEAVTAP